MMAQMHSYPALRSLAVHAVIIALILTFGWAVHKLPASHIHSLVLSPSLPVPVTTPVCHPGGHLSRPTWRFLSPSSLVVSTQRL